MKSYIVSVSFTVCVDIKDDTYEIDDYLSEMEYDFITPDHIDADIQSVEMSCYDVIDRDDGEDTEEDESEEDESEEDDENTELSVRDEGE